MAPQASGSSGSTGNNKGSIVAVVVVVVVVFVSVVFVLGCFKLKMKRQVGKTFRMSGDAAAS